MTIRVSGQAKVTVDYSVDLDMTMEDFDALSQGKQDQLIVNHTDWSKASYSSEVEIDDHVDVVKVVE